MSARRLDPYQRRQIPRLYWHDGKTISEIARLFRCSRWTVRYWLRKGTKHEQ